MRICMFHPVGHPMERGWVGRVDDDRVVQLAAQTLQSFFTGGGAAREHAEYPLAEVQLLAPVLHPPSIRVFDEQWGCAFANPGAVKGPGSEIDARGDELSLLPRLAAVIGAEGEIAAYTLFAEWRAPGRPAPKDRDFALGLGPVAVTADAFEPDRRAVRARVNGAAQVGGEFTGFDWPAALALAAEGTRLFPGDLLAGPYAAAMEGIGAGAEVEVECDGIGVLAQRVAG
jgi:hypothetical protein